MGANQSIITAEVTDKDNPANVHLTSLVPLMRTCKRVNGIITDNKTALCKKIYLAHLDAPACELDWVEEVKKLALVAERCSTENPVITGGEFYLIGVTMVHLVRTAKATPGLKPVPSAPTHLPSRNAAFVASLCEDPDIRDMFLYLSGIYRRIPTSHIPRQTFWDDDLAVSQLRCLHGQVDSVGVDGDWAAFKTYNLSEYTRFNSWGPFRDDLGGEVDWTRVEASMVVLANNTKTQLWDGLGCMTRLPPFSGSYPNSFYCPPLRRQSLFDADHDPYGITGTWIRLSSSMTPHSFHVYNTLPAGMPWEMGERLFSSQSTEVVVMDLRARAPVTATPLSMAHFQGYARSMDTEDSRLCTISGTCCMTAGGEVRWSALCVYKEGSSWRFEAVQIGGVRSARGAIGTWFPANRAPHGPVGPVAFWKVSCMPLSVPGLDGLRAELVSRNRQGQL